MAKEERLTGAEVETDRIRLKGTDRQRLRRAEVVSGLV